MWHNGRWAIELTHTGEGYFREDEFLRKDIVKRDRGEVLRVCNLCGINEKDIEMIMKNEEVYFNTEQLQEFLEHSNEISNLVADKNTI